MIPARPTALIEADIILAGPDGAWVNNRYIGGEGFLAATVLPTTGTYTPIRDPREAITGTATLTTRTKR